MKRLLVVLFLVASATAVASKHFTIGGVTISDVRLFCRGIAGEEQTHYACARPACEIAVGCEYDCMIENNEAGKIERCMNACFSTAVKSLKNQCPR